MKRPLLAPLIPLYAAAQALHNALRPAPRRLTRPVLSVGSLSAGGAGKTPVVQALATLLQRHGYTPVILSRGYGRTPGQKKAVAEKVDSLGSASRFGDEPLLLARSGLGVYVAPNRYAAGLLAEQDAGPHLPTLIHLLDDGFQHRRLHRTLDLVLLTEQDLRDTLLPAGNLREPLRALRRAHLILLRTPEAAALKPYLPPAVPTIFLNRILTPPSPLPSRAIAFAALARPHSFFADLRALNIPLAAAIPFPDHHHYTFQDIRKLKLLAAQHHADAFLTTAKDAVKLTPPLLAALTQATGDQSIPLHTISLTVTFPEPRPGEATLWSLLAPHLLPNS